MTQAAEAESWAPATVQVLPRMRRPDRQRVCEILGRVAAEVLSEVEAGTWRPPATLGIRSLLTEPAAEGTRPRLTAVGA
jgi:hypothetical protein